MSGRSKSDALIRDIAKLFVTYSPRDWAPILEQLHGGGIVQAKIAEAVAALQVEAQSSSQKTKIRSKFIKKKLPSKIGHRPSIDYALSERGPVLDALEKAIRERQLLYGAKELRDFYFKIGGKDSLPKDRLGAIRELLRFLDVLPQDGFDAAMDVLRNQNPATDSLADDYRRWFNLIQATPRIPK